MFVKRNNVCDYEVNRLTNEKLLEENKTFNTNCLRRRTPATRQDRFTNLLAEPFFQPVNVPLIGPQKQKQLGLNCRLVLTAKHK